MMGWAMNTFVLSLFRLFGATNNALTKAEVCIEGRRIGENGWAKRNKPFPLTATKKIVYMWPYQYDGYGGLQNPKASGGSKKADKRMCGVHPYGHGKKKYENYSIFEMTAKKLEAILGLTPHPHGIYGNGKDPYKLTQVGWYAWTMNYGSVGYVRSRHFWNDGAVDAENCRKGSTFGTLWSNTSLTATNHDSGTCRSGYYGGESWRDACRLWAQWA